MVIDFRVHIAFCNIALYSLQNYFHIGALEAHTNDSSFILFYEGSNSGVVQYVIGPVDPKTMCPFPLL